VQDVRQRRALLGPAAAGRAGRRQVGRRLHGELPHHRVEVAADGVPKVLEAHDLPVAVELDLGHDALDDQVDQSGKPRPERSRDLGDLGRQDAARTMRAVTPGREVLHGSSVSQRGGGGQDARATPTREGHQCNGVSATRG
jgi:hypothetical protein